MLRSASHHIDSHGLHVAIIMDGSGRWAKARGLPRIAGHREGTKAVRSVVSAAPGLGIRTLTLYAFSSDNWHRPVREVEALMGLFRAYLMEDADTWVARGIRVSVIGRRDRIPPELVVTARDVEAATERGHLLHLKIAIDYSAREAILSAACQLSRGAEVPQEEFSRLLAYVGHAGGLAPDVDLLIRTGGERRLSDFLLWESAYAELLFTERMWPDFGAEELEAAVREFHSRQRRFGCLPEEASSSH